jgi:hypothetical protein
MPESLRALFRIVSFTAAKTSRIFDVSVACVRLAVLCQFTVTGNKKERKKGKDPPGLLRVQVQMRPVHLIKPPEQILRGLVDVVAT